MNESLQTIAALSLVSIAGGFVLVKLTGVFTKKKSSGCGACSSCPASSEAPKAFVSLDALENRRAS